MKPRSTSTLLSLLLIAPASAQSFLYGLRGNGDLLRLDPTTGQGTLIASAGSPCDAAIVSGEYIITSGGSTELSDRFVALNRWTGETIWTRPVGNRPADYEVRGLANFGDTVYVLLTSSTPSTPSLLARTHLGSSAMSYTVIGSTGQTSLQTIGSGPNSSLYAIGTDAGGTLFQVNTATGAATPIGTGGMGSDLTSLTSSAGSFLACGSNLVSIDSSTGDATVIGATGFTDIRGLAPVTREPCYADCDRAVGIIPRLTVADFTCFLVRFAAGDPYTNCDNSTVPPVLNVADFTCFLQQFSAAAGC